ncbi:hypothetical protein COK67_14985 [Bacillus cereus]|nr:hypothetical protein COK67_14985 [Bacillus cereus]PGU52601.1 hypothetical protein COD72_21120 [Bacillus cereus]
MDVWRDYMKESFALLTKNGRLWLDEILTAFYVVPIFLDVIKGRIVVSGICQIPCICCPIWKNLVYFCSKCLRRLP